MDQNISFNALVEESIKKYWEKDALTDYKGITLQYHDVARKIEKMHIMFENGGVHKGDKIALCGRNSSMWACAFLAVITYGAVVVPVQHEFKAEQIHNIVNHSEAKLLFVGDVVATQVDAEQMPSLEGIVYLPDLSLVISRSEELTYAREHLNEIFGCKYPKFFRKEHVSYYHDTPEEMAEINYTSGTTGFSKGVMIPYRAIYNNFVYMRDHVYSNVGKDSRMLSTLPMAHMYGLSFEFLAGFCTGSHVYFLTRLPSPTLIAGAFAEIHPAIIVAVPMVVEKIIRKKVFPLVQNSRVKLLMQMPVVNKKVKEHIRQMVYNIFGGNAYEVVCGGAGLNHEIDRFLHSIGFPITQGYGTTETAPLITYSDYHNYVQGSCGTVVEGMEVRIDSSDPEHIPGEILTRGLNLMLGYYKNPDATKAVIDEEGWFHTGDLATMSADGHVFIRGRMKNMLLGSNGQNIYPEEIESKLNNMAMVSESLVLQKGDKLYGLVHPDLEEAHAMGLSDDDLSQIMEENRVALNSAMPAFCHISQLILHDKEFEKTPKKSIKRYLYKDAI